MRGGRAIGLWLATALVFLVLHQLGYTSVAWHALEARGAPAGREPTAQAALEDGTWGRVRAYLRTDSDERLFQEYARLLWHGRIDLDYLASKRRDGMAIAAADVARPYPYRDVSVEYPPVALFYSSLPGLLSDDPFWFRFWLAALNLVTWFACFQVAARVGARAGLSRPLDPDGHARLALVAFLAALFMGNVVASRLDLPAVLFVLLGVHAALAGRPVVALLCLVLGTYTKIFPVLLAPLFLVHAWRAGGLRPAALAALVGGGVGLAAFAAMYALCGDNWLAMFRYHGARGLQIETTYSSVLLALQVGGLDVVRVVNNYASTNLAGAAAQVLASLAMPLVVVGLGVCAWFERGQPRRFVWLVLVSLWIVVAGSKVLSMQFLLWLLPLALAVGASPALPGLRRPAVWLLGACALTAAIYPRPYYLLAALHPAVVAALLVRNALLVGGLISLLRTRREV